MTAYAYQAYIGTDLSSGTIDAPDDATARALLRNQGLVISDLTVVRKQGVNRQINLRKTLKLSESAWIARQLAIMTGSGMPLPRSLAMLARQREGKRAGTILDDIHRQIVDGNQVSSAFASHEKELGQLFVALVATGEKSGKLAESLAKLANLLERRNYLRKQVRSALTYPAGVLLTTLSIALAMVLFVVPVFRSVFSQLGGKLPLPTRILVGTSNLLLNNLWIFPVLLIGAVVGWRELRKSHVWHKRIDAAFLRIPIVGKLLSKAALARVASTLSTTLGVGVHLIEALDYSASAAGNYVFADALRAAGQEVAGGQALSAAFEAQEGLPEVLSQMTVVGEESGSVTEILSRFAEETNREVDITVESLTASLEPVLMVLIGTLVGSIVISLYLPMFDVINLIGSQKP